MTSSPARRTEVRLRIETNPVDAFTFLQLNSYPYFWAPDDLAAGLVVRVLNGEGELRGYVWGGFTAPGAFTFHVCAKAGTRLPWFSSDLLDQLCRTGFLMGADELRTRLRDRVEDRALSRLLQRLGFTLSDPEPDGGITLSLNLWNHNGLEQRRLARAEQHPGAPAV